MIRVRRAGPAVTVQDGGRPGYLSRGLSRGGAADRLALAEGAALLGQPESCAALEMAAFGGEFEADQDHRIALTGAPMRATLDGAPLVWNASHLMRAGARLCIGATESGRYGYLSVGGGVDAPMRLGARGVHLAAGLGARAQAGDRLAVGADPGGPVGMALDVADRFSGGTVRVLPAIQTAMFPEAERRRFAETVFTPDRRANRMGVRLNAEGPGFGAEGGLSVLSETVAPGDVQVAGDGAPFALLVECQTTGGYPRIAAILPQDLPRMAQAPDGAPIRFSWLDEAAALAAHRAYAAERAALPSRVRPLLCDPHDMRDLLSYQLISGAVAGDEAG